MYVAERRRESDEERRRHPEAPAAVAPSNAQLARRLDARLHTDSPRAGGTRLAVTEGRDVHFASGAYRPGTPAGDHLIAHELAHVVQQRRGATGQASSAALEADAERAAASGRPEDALLGAPAGPQCFEANEHISLGNTAGGETISVVTTSGVALTYGEIVALSGDFYRSPEAIMNAPADELNRILGVMRTEQAAVARTGGFMTPGDAAALNSAYEAATSTSDRAHHHDHSDFEGHSDHDADEEADDEDRVYDDHEPRRRSKYGPLVGDEHVEDAGEPEPGSGTEPSATGTFLDLADENSSHFSPENIRLNFKPKHLMALDMGREAWQARNPGRAAPPLPTGDAPNADAAEQGEGAEPGAMPSARMHTTPDQTGAPMADAAAEATTDPATPTTVSGAGKGAGEVAEARALMTSAFAAHFLTDSFAGGHVVSGVVGRTHAPAWFAANRARVEAALAGFYERDGSWGWTARLKAKSMLGVLDGAGKVPGVLLKLVHDTFNEEGILVKNARGTVWPTKGDGSLAGSAETQAQAEAATKTARDAVQQTIATGTTPQPYGALDFVPDVVQTPGSGWRPIEDGAKDPKVFDDVWERTMISGDRFYKLVQSYGSSIAGLAGSMAKMKAHRVVEGAKRYMRKGWKAVVSAASTVKEVGIAAKDKAVELGTKVEHWIGERWDDAKTGAANTWDAVKAWTADKVEKVREAGSAAAQWIGDAYDTAQRWGADKVGRLAEGAENLSRKASSAAKAIANRVLSLFSREAPAVGDFPEVEEREREYV